MAAHEALSPIRSPSLLRIPFVQGVFKRHSRSMDEPRDRPCALVHERQLSPLGGGSWGHFCVAQCPRECRYVSSLTGISKGFSSELLNQFRQRLPGFTRYMGKKATLTNIGDEGSPRCQVVEEKGTYEQRAAKYVLLPGETKLPPIWALTTYHWDT